MRFACVFYDDSARPPIAGTAKACGTCVLLQAPLLQPSMLAPTQATWLLANFSLTNM